ncbi:MAG TPA: pyridoxamine 5'-phosphate oxidase family protein [Acidimicrobiales bacterium]|nr:pyridoxamine 5'-phosphate oxidase family protein [Acidimicrobiales bacterium]
MTTPDDRAVTSLPQGDPQLLAAPAAQELLGRALPARLAYVSPDGTPRIVPTWFHWTGDEVVMATWAAGPHIQRAARRIEHLRRNPAVALSIDTDDQPPTVLQMRGRAQIDEVDGIVDEYARSAEKYIGLEAGRAYIAQFDPASVRMARIAVRPTWVGLLDFAERLPAPLGGVVER